MGNFGVKYPKMIMRKQTIISILSLVCFAISAKGATALPYHNTCDDINTVTVLNESTQAAYKWQSASYSGDNVFRCKQGSSDAVRTVHATMWTPALAIETGKVYRVSALIGVNTPADVSKGRIAMYSSPAASASYTVLAEEGPLPQFTTSTRPLKALEAIFVGDASKPYIGITNSGGGVTVYFVVDDIIVEEYTGSLPPQEIENLNSAVDGKNVNITFTLPSKNLGNQDLGEITAVTLTRDGMSVKEWSSQTPGATLTYQDVVSTGGDYKYVVTASVGEDQTSKNITVNVGGVSAPDVFTTYQDKDENGETIGYNYKAAAVFEPDKGITINWYSAGDGVAYKVIRLGDRKVIADNVTALTVTDTDVDPQRANTYQYEISKIEGGNTSRLYISSAVSLGNSVPFIPNISNEATYEFTIVDADRDTDTWKALTSASEEKHGVTRYFYTPRCGDDWLITPGIMMEAGKSYRIDVDALCGSIAESNVKMGINAGRSNAIESQTEVLLEPVVFSQMTPRTHSVYYTTEETGNIFIGIRSLDPNGNHRFNDLGVSSIKVTEVAADTPKAVADFRMDYSATAGEGALRFTAPTQTVGGQPLVSITKIEICQDGELIKTIENAEPGKEYSEPVSFPLSKVIEFTVASVNSSSSLPAELTLMQLLPPYTNTFAKEEDANGFTIIEPSLAGYTWGYHSNSQAMRCYGGITDFHDDYLVSPALHLEAGNFYKIDFTTWLDRSDADYDYAFDNTIEVLLGNALTLEALKETVVQPYVIHGAADSQVLLKDWFTVPATGEYYLAWHVTSSPNRTREIFIDDINISAKIPDTYPAGVDNFKITPDAEGALNAKVTFNLPTKDMAGKPLAGNFYGYKLYCDGFEISEGAGELGKYVEFLHPASQGVHLFTVRCFGAEGEPTRDIEDVAYIGINRPGAVEFVEVTENTDNYGEVTLTWGVPEFDIDGFPLNTSDITYTVGQFVGNGSEAQEIEYATGVKTLSYTKQVMTNADTQEFMRFFVRANTSAGKGNPTVLTKYTAVGKPFTLPYKESFRNGFEEHRMIQEYPYEGKYASWGYNTYCPVTNVQPVDNDRGLGLMETMEPESGARLFTLRIELDTDNPVMTFYVYNQSNASRTDSNILGISVREGNGEFVVVDSKSIDEWAHGNPGWQKASVDLSAYAHKTVYIGLDGLAKNMTFIHIDNIVIDNPLDIDVALMGVAHPKVYVGKDHEVSVNLNNHGRLDASNVKVSLKLDDKEVETRTVEKVESGKTASIVFSNKLGREAVGRHVYSASITAEGDADGLNNSCEAPFFYLQDNAFPPVENLEAVMKDQEVELAWQLPNIPEAPEEITDDFESYPSWTTIATGGLGDYTLIDADGCAVGGFADHDLPNIPFGSKQSFVLWDFTDEYFAYDQSISDRYKAHSGNKCLVSSYAPGEESWTEDRLISPELTGEAQTISFYAKALEDDRPEIFQVYYSLDGTNLKDYVDNRFPRQTVGGKWKEFTYDLPEGTKYFVIEHYSNAYTGGYFFFLDDLTYTPVGDETLEIEGYNVYRNDALLTASPIEALNWIDSDPQDSRKKYAVSVVYDRGESPMVEANIQTTTIGDMTASNVKVWSSDGEIVIEGAEGFDFTVATVSGMVLTSRQAGAESIRIPVAAGIYIVNVNGQTYKLILN